MFFIRYIMSIMFKIFLLLLVFGLLEKLIGEEFTFLSDKNNYYKRPSEEDDIV